MEGKRDVIYLSSNEALVKIFCISTYYWYQYFGIVIRL